MATPHEVLLILNGLVEINYDDLWFAVITAPREDGRGWWPFQPYEVLVVNEEYGREPFGEGRKPAKWDVQCEYFKTFAEAMDCLNRVKPKE